MKIIQHFLNNSLRNYNYVIASEVNNKAIFIDPFDIDQTLPLCHKEGKIPKYLLYTHYHPDHTKDNERFLALETSELLEIEHDKFFELSETETIKCIFTPGHVADHVCFFLYEKDSLVSVITGDTVFNAGIGNCKSMGGDPKVLYQTIKNIFIPLEDHVKIYPSHDYLLTNLGFLKNIEPDNEFVDKYLALKKEADDRGQYFNTTIGDEKKINPFFRAIESEEKFIELRRKRDTW